MCPALLQLMTSKGSQCLQICCNTPACLQIWRGKTTAQFATYAAIVLADGSFKSVTDGALCRFQRRSG